MLRLLLVALLATAPITTGEPVPTGTTNQDSKPAINEQAREQYLKLAPLLTMSDPWHLEDLNLQLCIEALEKVAEYRALKFDADPALAEVGPRVVDFLVQAQTTVVPGIRASLDPKTVFENPEGALVALLVEHASRYMENQVLREWQCQLDRTCQSSWKRLLPLARSLGGPEDKGALVKIRVEGTGSSARLLAENVTPGALTNVVLALNLTSIGGEKLEHYFFIPTWASKEVVPLRVAVDWWTVGPARTTGGTIEVISDETRSPSRAFALPENIAVAVRATLSAADARVKANDPGEALKMIASATSAASGVSSKMPELVQECRAKSSAIRGVLTEQLRKLEGERDAAIAVYKKTEQAFSDAYRTDKEPQAKKAKDAASLKVKDVEAKLAAVRKIIHSEK